MKLKKMVCVMLVFAVLTGLCVVTYAKEKSEQEQTVVYSKVKPFADVVDSP